MARVPALDLLRRDRTRAASSGAVRATPVCPTVGRSDDGLWYVMAYCDVSITAYARMYCSIDRFRHDEVAARPVFFVSVFRTEVALRQLASMSASSGIDDASRFG